MEASKNSTLSLITKCLDEARKQSDLVKGQDAKVDADYKEIIKTASNHYWQVKSLPEDSEEIQKIYDEYMELERELEENMERYNNNHNNYNDNNNDVIDKFTVIEAINRVMALAKEKLRKTERGSKDALYLNAVVSEAQNDINNVRTLNDDDPALNDIFSKYSSIYNRIENTQESRQSSNNGSSTASASDIAFEASRNAPKHTKEEVIDLISDCKLKLAGLNTEGLIAIEDQDAWDELMTRISEDYYAITNMDPRDKKAINRLYQQYRLTQKDVNRLVDDLTSKDKGKNNTPKSDIITKDSIIDKLEDARDDIKRIIKHKKLNKNTKKALSSLSNEMGTLEDEIEALDEFSEQSKVKRADRKADKLIEELNSYGFNPRRVTGKIREEDQDEVTKDDRTELVVSILKVAALLGLGALAAFLIMNYGKFNFDNDKDNDPNKNNGGPSFFPSFGQNTPAPSSDINNIDIENYEELLGYAMDIQSKLDPSTPLAIEDIMYCIRLANFDNLKDKAVFRERDEVCASTYNMGAIARGVGINSIVGKDTNADIYIPDETMLDITMCATNLQVTRDDFAEAKTAKGYDIYTVCQICLDNMYGADSEKAFYFCRIFNDITARLHQDFSVVPNCPISTRYVLAGMYTGNADKILELTAGQVLGPIYGSGYRIDGTYGNMCVEELEAFMRINRGAGEAVGNELNMLYTAIIDENITNYFTQGSR